MTSLLIRNVDQRTVDRLKARAKRNGRSLQGEIKAILEEQAGWMTMAEAAAEADRIRQELGASGLYFGDSTELIREDREAPDR